MAISKQKFDNSTANENNMKGVFQSSASIAVFGILLLAGNSGLVADNANDGTKDGDATSTCESGSEEGTCSSNGDAVFAPILEKPAEMFPSSRPEIRLAVRGEFQTTKM